MSGTFVATVNGLILWKAAIGPFCFSPKFSIGSLPNGQTAYANNDPDELLNVV